MGPSHYLDSEGKTSSVLAQCALGLSGQKGHKDPSSKKYWDISRKFTYMDQTQSRHVTMEMGHCSDHMGKMPKRTSFLEIKMLPFTRTEDKCHNY